MHQLTNHINLHLNVLDVVIVNYCKMKYENNSKGRYDKMLTLLYNQSGGSRFEKFRSIILGC